ncbi:SDO1-like protein C21C3.19 [Psilocybe cubensis]|uniref:SDO1-like protein C21C3.19 n=1 Tax=Psilocybe cubensis TaxID=181762 RepID=A0ACB8H5S2_PSICU|nr:SDO1-like protein C21C3.19 [Psilocybe cubensis]KAH9482525.1 SDO1-like protein C21C3.19 [Psilocybe cubensis]
MPSALTKVIYKPDSQSTDEFMIIVNPDAYKKWKDGAFTVFHTGQGSQGILRQPSKQQLDTVFGTHKDIDVVEFMLKNGKEQSGEGIKDAFSLNLARGSNIVDSRGKGLTGI